MINDILSELSREMDETVDSLKHDLARVRTGRANPSLLDGVVVNYYGTDTPLNKLATVSAPEAQMLVVQPFDQGIAADIEAAISAASDFFTLIRAESFRGIRKVSRSCGIRPTRGSSSRTTRFVCRRAWLE